MGWRHTPSVALRDRPSTNGLGRIALIEVEAVAFDWFDPRGELHQPASLRLLVILRLDETTTTRQSSGSIVRTFPL